MTDTTKQIDRAELLVLAAEAGFGIAGCSFIMPPATPGHMTTEMERFAELLAIRAALKGKAAPAAQAADSELSPPDVTTLMRWSRALMGLSAGNYFRDRRNMLCEQAADLLSQIATPAAVPQGVEAQKGQQP